MTESSCDIVVRYLQDAVAAERAFEVQLRDFAQDGDDEEVQAVFATHADETGHQHERLKRRLEELGGAPSFIKGFLAQFLDVTSNIARIEHAREERTSRNLMAAFAFESGECAMYETLATIASASGDSVTAALAREIQAEERRTADKLWRFLPSRTKIAFNMLTLSEVDPGVETRISEGRIV